MAGSTANRTRIWVAVIGALALVIGAVITAVVKVPDKTSSSPPILFQGSVRNAGGDPVAGAQVQANLDSGTGQSAITDSEGIFHLDIAGQPGMVYLSVAREGYRRLDRAVDLRQQHMVSLTLTPVLKPEGSKGDEVPPGRLPGRRASAVPPQHREFASQVKPNCPPGDPSCAAVEADRRPGEVGPVVPDAFIAAQQPLRALDRTQQPNARRDLFVEDEHGDQPYHPGIEVTIGSRAAFPTPCFAITCDRTCTPSMGSLTERAGGVNRETKITLVARPLSHDGKVWEVRPTLSSGMLEMGEYLTVRVRSGDGEPVRITAVRSR